MIPKKLLVKLKKINKWIKFLSFEKVFLLALAAIGLALTLFFYFPVPDLATRTAIDWSTAGAFEKCQKSSVLSKRIDCYDRFIVQYLETNSPEILLQEFKKAMDENGQVRKDCHQVAHAIGRATLGKLGDISAVFRLDRNLDACAGGFFHGAIEKLFRSDQDTPLEQHISPDEFKKKIPILCGQFEEIDRQSECVHGVGHGALFIQGDLKKSLDTCRLFPKNSDHFSCHSGVFMEYSISGQAKENNKKDRHFPCNQFSASQRNACYYVHSFRLTDLGLSYGELVKECRKAPGAGGGFCVRGYGIFFLAHEALAKGPEPIVEFCESLNKSDARVCAESVASRLAAHVKNGQYAMPFCSLFNSDYLRKRCFSYTGEVLRLGHKVESELIINDCKKYANNPQECINSAPK